VGEKTICAIVYRDGDWWIIRCLDYNLVTAARHLEEVPGELRRFLLVQIAASRQRGIEPFSGIPQASPKYWEMYEKGRTWNLSTSSIELPRAARGTGAESRCTPCRLKPSVSLGIKVEVGWRNVEKEAGAGATPEASRRQDRFLAGHAPLRFQSRTIR
jgi:hypothetical protein